MENRKYAKYYVREYANLYIHENLCPKYKAIFEKCNELKQQGLIKYVWTWNGMVHYKKNDNPYEHGKKVFHISDLEEQFDLNDTRSET